MPLHKLGVEGGCVRVVPGVRNLVWSRSELGGVVLMPGPWVHHRPIIRTAHRHRFVARAELRPSLRAIWRRTSSGLAWNMRRADGCLWPL
jgi:hypothetical protein